MSEELRMYDPTHKLSTITLTEDEGLLLMQLLGPSVDYDEDNIASALYDKLTAAIESGRDGHRVFIVNVYELFRAYGGPEEGGWYYDVHHCIRWVACSSVAEAIGYVLNEAYELYSSHDLIEMGLEYSREMTEDDMCYPSYDTNMALLEALWEKSGPTESERWIELGNIDALGCGHLIAIEHVIAQRETRRRPYYE